MCCNDMIVSLVILVQTLLLIAGATSFTIPQYSLRRLLPMPFSLTHINKAVLIHDRGEYAPSIELYAQHIH